METGSLCAFAALCAFFAWLWSRRQEYALARQLPGSRWALPLVGHTYLFFGYDQESLFARMRSVLEADLRSFPYIKIWLGPQLVVIVTDAGCAQKIIYNRTVLHKGDLLHAADPIVGNGMLFGSGAEVRRRRRGILPSLKMKMLEQYLEVFHRHSTVLQEVLDELVVDGEEFNLEEQLHHCSFDGVNETTINVRTNTLRGQNRDLVKAFIEVYGLLYQEIMKPWLYLGRRALRKLGFQFKSDEICQMLDTHIGQALKRKKSYLQNENIHEAKTSNTFIEKRTSNVYADTEMLNASTSKPYPNGHMPTDKLYPNGDMSTDTSYPVGDMSTDKLYPNGDMCIDKSYANGEMSTDKLYPNGDMSTNKSYPNGDISTDKSSPNGDMSINKPYHSGHVSKHKPHPNGSAKDQVHQNGDFTREHTKQNCGSATDNVENHSDEDCRTAPEIISTLEYMLRSEFEISDEDLIMEMKNIFLASSDTVATICSFLFKMLAIHPEYQERAYQEAVQVLGENPGVPVVSDLARLELLETCLKETLRLFPIAPFIPRKCGEPLRLDDQMTLPTGTTLLVGAFWLHRSPEHWQKPEQFYPEHFSPPLQASRHQAAFLPFSGGPHSCIGQQYAMLFMKVMAAMILLKFRVEPADSDYVSCHDDHSAVSVNSAREDGGAVKRTQNGGHNKKTRCGAVVQDGGDLNTAERSCQHRVLCQRKGCQGRYIPEDYVANMNLGTDISVRLVGGVRVKVSKRNRK